MRIAWLPVLIVFIACVVIGVGAQWKFGINWFSVAATLQGFLWLLGLWAAEDESWPGDGGYHSLPDTVEFHKQAKSLRIHKSMIVIAISLGVVTYCLSAGIQQLLICFGSSR